MKREKEKLIRSVESELSRKFWSRVNIRESDKCWNWTRYAASDGYGRIYFEGKVLLVHRVAYMLDKETEINRNTLVLQTCKNTRCCNPAHFEISTRKKQLEAMAQKGSTRGYAQRGQDNHSAKLTSEQVVEIRRLFATGIYSKGELGRMFNICGDQVVRIAKRVWWKWLK